MRAAKVSAYPETIHSSSDRSTPRSRWIDGSATFTTVLSSMIMNSPNDTAASVHHCLFSSVTSRARICTTSPTFSLLVHTTLAPANTRRSTLRVRNTGVRTIDAVPVFICPNCRTRSVDVDGYEGFTNNAPQCRNCGFGFLFQLLE